MATAEVVGRLEWRSRRWLAVAARAVAASHAVRLPDVAPTLASGVTTHWWVDAVNEACEVRAERGVDQGCPLASPASAPRCSLAPGLDTRALCSSPASGSRPASTEATGHPREVGATESLCPGPTSTSGACPPTPQTRTSSTCVKSRLTSHLTAFADLFLLDLDRSFRLRLSWTRQLTDARDMDL